MWKGARQVGVHLSVLAAAACSAENDGGAASAVDAAADRSADGSSVRDMGATDGADERGGIDVEAGNDGRAADNRGDASAADVVSDRGGSEVSADARADADEGRPLDGAVDGNDGSLE